jgi:hypothetical protein
MRCFLLRPLLAIFSVTLMSLLLQGCAVAAVGAGVGAWKAGNAQKAQADAACKTAYNDYLEHMQKIDPENIIPLDQYCGK